MSRGLGEFASRAGAPEAEVGNARVRVPVLPSLRWAILLSTPATSRIVSRRSGDTPLNEQTYHPPKAELDEDMRARATFEEAVEALTQPVKVRYMPRSKRHPEFGRFGAMLHNLLSITCSHTDRRGLLAELGVQLRRLKGEGHA